MKFKVLADSFDRVEKVSKRLEMTDLLAELFEKSDVEEIARVIYLCQGQLAPPYKDIEIGMGEKYAEEAIAKAAGYTKTDVEKEFKKKAIWVLLQKNF